MKQDQTKQFQLVTHFKAEADPAVPDTIKLFGWANYAGMPDAEGYGTYVDLCGDTVDPQGFDLSVYTLNPIILLQHDRDDPIGKATKVEKRADGLWIECEIYKDSCEEIEYNRIKNGILKCFSVGFRARRVEFRQNEAGKEICHILEAQLFEVSVVSIPANSASLFDIKALSDGSISGSPKIETKNIPSTRNEDGDMKLKLRELLSEDRIKEFESLGLEAQLDVEQEVSFVKYLDMMLTKADSSMGMKMRQAVEEVCREVVGQVMKEKSEAEAKAAQEELEAKAVAEALKALADELGITEEEAKGLTEEQIAEKRQEIASQKQDELSDEEVKELTDKFETMRKAFEEATKALTVEGK